MALKQSIERASLAASAGLIPHYLAFYLIGSPLWTETISEWIMANTPSRYAVPLLTTLGPWAKPFAVTGALAILGFVIFVLLPLRWAGPIVAAALLGWLFAYTSWIGQLTFWLPVLWVVTRSPQLAPTGRRDFLTSAVMTLGTFSVAVESYLRDAALARRAVSPVSLFPFTPPAERFFPALVRKAVTPVEQFYGMSKNTVDPATNPDTWRLKITENGRLLRQFTYRELLSLPRTERYITLRCVSNTLKSDLMGTAAWSGIHLSQLADRAALSPGIVETAIIGVDGHGDSLRLDYAFGDETILALGMNGKTLDRVHGFPIRLLVPRYYGFKNVKWISEIAFVSTPYFGTWPKLGYTKEPAVHTASHIDKIHNTGWSLQAGGVSFAGTRGIKAVRVRTGQGPWVDATLDKKLSPFCWTRWAVELPGAQAGQIEAQAMDGEGNWQESVEGPLFPTGVTGPTIRSLG